MATKKLKKDTQQIEPSTEAKTIYTTTYPPSPANEILAKLVAALILIFISWPIAIFLLKTAGIKHPEETLAQTLVFLPLSVLLLFGLRLIIGDMFTRWLDHRLEQKQADIELTRLRYAMQLNMAATSRSIGDNKRFEELIIAVLFDAYEYHHKYGRFTSIKRPWSRREAEKIIMVDNQPAGYALATKVRPFLEANQIIVNNQLNLKKYPDISSVKELLQGPVLLNTNQLPTNQPQNWSIIENS